MVKNNEKGRTELLIKLTQDLESKFLQLYEEIKVGKTSQGLWEYTFINPLTKHFKIEDLKDVIQEATARIINDKLLISNRMDTDENNFFDYKGKIDMTSFLFQARNKYKIFLVFIRINKVTYYIINFKKK